MKIDVSSVADTASTDGLAVSTATLNYYVTNGAGPAYVYDVVSSWEESTVSYNSPLPAIVENESHVSETALFSQSCRNAQPPVDAQNVKYGKPRAAAVSAQSFADVAVSLNIALSSPAHVPNWSFP